MIKTRALLKEDFSNGNIPTGASFAALIDSLAHRDELRSEAFKGNDAPPPTAAKHGAGAAGLHALQCQFDESGNLLICQQETVLATLSAQQQQWILAAQPQRPIPLVVDGWLQLAGRVGGYNPAADMAQTAPSAATTASLQVDADGKWHPILPNLSGCYAFEIVAHASGKPTSRRHAMLHAIVLTSFNGSLQSISLTRACQGWAWRWNLRLKWRKRRPGWLRRVTGYDLCLKSGCHYGTDADGYKVLIHYHITRLW